MLNIHTCRMAMILVCSHIRTQKMIARLLNEGNREHVSLTLEIRKGNGVFIYFKRKDHLKNMRYAFTMGGRVNLPSKQNDRCIST